MRQPSSESSPFIIELSSFPILMPMAIRYYSCSPSLHATGDKLNLEHNHVAIDKKTEDKSCVSFSGNNQWHVNNLFIISALWFSHLESEDHFSCSLYIPGL